VSEANGSPLRCLVTGASGYIGGRLVPALLEEGHRVRCLARTPAKLRDHPWAPDVEVVGGDVTDTGDLRAALRGVDVAYYLVHALGSGPDFEETDRRAARAFGAEARRAGVRRIVYLGGLTPEGVPERDLSPHLGRPHPADVGGTDGRAPGGRGDRLRIGVVRDAPLPHRTAARDGDAQLGAHPDPAGGRP
jgi:nucleoside-diphosphate-sugar epimerase